MNAFDSLPEELKKVWTDTRPTNEVLPKLEEKIKSLENDPLYYAEFLKADFAEAIFNAMEEQGLNKKTLSEELGLSRQYVGKVLNENANFTIETMAAFALALGKKVRINLTDFASDYISTQEQLSANIDILIKDINAIACGDILLRLSQEKDFITEELKPEEVEEAHEHDKSLAA